MKTVINFQKNGKLSEIYATHKKVIDKCVFASVEETAEIMGLQNFALAVCGRSSQEQELAA